MGSTRKKLDLQGRTANIVFYASDGYTVPYSVSESSANDVIIAYELDGFPLPETLRLVVPDANGEAWIAMITTMLVNSPLYAYSPNPQAASITLNQPTLQQSSTPSPSPTPKIRDQSTPQPTAKPTFPPSTTQPIQQQPPLSSKLTNKILLYTAGDNCVRSSGHRLPILSIQKAKNYVFTGNLKCF